MVEVPDSQPTATGSSGKTDPDIQILGSRLATATATSGSRGGRGRRGGRGGQNHGTGRNVREFDPEEGFYVGTASGRHAYLTQPLMGVGHTLRAHNVDANGKADRNRWTPVDRADIAWNFDYNDFAEDPDALLVGGWTDEGFRRWVDEMMECH